MRKSEKEGEREKERKREGDRERETVRKRERQINVELSRIVIFIFKRNDRCPGTF